jgi:hypothetical protein
MSQDEHDQKYHYDSWRETHRPDLGSQEQAINGGCFPVVLAALLLPATVIALAVFQLV